MIQIRIENVIGLTLTNNPFDSFDGVQNYIEQDNARGTANDEKYNLWINYGERNQQYIGFTREEAISKNVKQVVLDHLEKIMNSTSTQVSAAWKLEAKELKIYIDELEYLEEIGI